MLGWSKRQRKDELAADVPLGSSPADVVGAAALPPGGSAASSLGSLGSELGDAGGELAAASTSIELAACSGRQAPELDAAGVRGKAAYFEALIHANTTAHIQLGACSAEGVQHRDLAAGLLEGDSADGSAWLQLQPRQAQHAQHAQAQAQQEYSEVQLVLRLPRPMAPTAAAVPPATTQYGTLEDMEALIERLRQELDLKEQLRAAAVAAYARRTAEVENLQRVVRELSESRAKAVSQRAAICEKYGELQQEYHRMLRIADLSRVVSKENLANTSRTRSELRQVQLELHATRTQAQSLSEKSKKVREENAALKEKVCLLERLDFEGTQESEVKKHFTRYRLTETY